MNDQLLQTSLLDLMYALGEGSRRVLLGGGYGLYLKQLHLAQTQRRTLMPVEVWPAPRATEDLDLMLDAELVADAHAMHAVRAALVQLEYEVVEGSEYLQFARTIDGTRAVKIDLLTAQLDVLQNNSSIHADARRARPVVNDRPKLHAHPTDGALALNESPLVIAIAGSLSNGKAVSTNINLPNAFTYLLMKLTAYRDRRGDAEKDLGRHHALDVFRIVAMLTEAEHKQVRQGILRLGDNAQVRSCGELVRSDFAHPTGAGMAKASRKGLTLESPVVRSHCRQAGEVLSSAVLGDPGRHGSAIDHLRDLITRQQVYT